MREYAIKGGAPLVGEVEIGGAKNAALGILAGALLSNETVEIENVPDLYDTNVMMDALRELGAYVEKVDRHTVRINGAGVHKTELDNDDLKKIRGSYYFAGSLLGKYKNAKIALPGGCNIGSRPVDQHIKGFNALGASYTKVRGRDVFELKAKKLKGCYMLLDETSVTGTANIIMAAVLAEGTTTIYNAACEPYIQQLCHMLNRMGATISGIGSNLLTIVGTKSLKGTEHKLLPDMIEVGSFIAMAAMVGDGIRIKGASIRNLGIIPDTFRRLGITIEEEGDDLYIPKHEKYQIDSFIDGTIMTISDAPWPGLTPDLLSVLLVVATQAEGCVLFHQKMFESRLFFVDKLIDMNAQIILCDPHRAVVIGHNHTRNLRAARMSSPDIRAGIALLIAAMSADGVSEISNIAQIDRGYENIEGRLNALGAKIRRN